MPTTSTWSALSLAAALTAAASLAAASPLGARSAASNAAPALGKRSDYITVPIKRRNADQLERRDADSFQRKAAALRNKYGGTAPNAVGSDGQPLRGKKRQHSIDMTSYQDSEWFGEIDVGTPANGFSVVLDTGSADLILAEPGCTGCQANTPGYNPGSSSTSSTSRQDFTIQYGSGSASGSLVEDRISIANYTQPNQIFAACSTMNNIVDGTISGILGLGWQNIAASQAMPLVQSLYENNTLPEPVFAFAFETHTFYTNSAPTAPGGTLTIGGLDTSQYTGSINWVSLVQPAGYWAIPLQDIHVGGKSLGITDQQVVIDTGTTLIGMPTADAQQVYSQIPNSRSINLQGESGYYSFPCTQSVNVAFTFGGQQYSVASDQFNAGAVDSTGQYCLGAIFALETGSSSSISFIIGDAFLTGVYNAYRFNPPAVGFAQLGSGGTANTGGESASTSGGLTSNAFKHTTNALAALAATAVGAFFLA
ncbi:hypothetical protein C6P46_003774 [Rhodotorula mucilaginosa]|uniref:Peptidase A1 domain-containing protein n=1 Tax=Rhodotorula mucilaginosa TaxID=5537 RepID=A0A9P6W2A9_RHOMI|nr:hypothetical protein C6P46_003774 [Rhodotorula mucilaginosa]TKA52666.1 hypothetical protein B0A53_04119 [Rhodotorula sp. CCFEE 5036]